MIQILIDQNAVTNVQGREDGSDVTGFVFFSVTKKIVNYDRLYVSVQARAHAVCVRVCVCVCVCVFNLSFSAVPSSFLFHSSHTKKKFLLFIYSLVLLFIYSSYLFIHKVIFLYTYLYIFCVYNNGLCPFVLTDFFHTFLIGLILLT